MLSCIADLNCALNCRPINRGRALMPFTAQTVPVGQLLANPFVIEAPAYQRSFAWSRQGSRQAAGRHRLRALDGSRSPQRRVLPGRHAVHRRDPAASPPDELASRAPRPRGRRRLPAADHAHHPAVRPARHRRRTRSPPIPGCLAAIGTAQGPNARPRLSLTGPDEAFFLAHVRAPGATRVRAKRDGRSPARGAHPGRCATTSSPC